MGSLSSRLPTAGWCGSHLACVPPVTAAERGYRGDCPAQGSAALPSTTHRRIEGGHDGSGHHRRGPAQAFRHHRNHQRAGETLGQGRFGTDRDGYQAMLAAGRKHKDRLWAVEGCNGIDRHVAQRLVADGETVVDVPAKLSARARVFTTGQGRKTDPVDARSVAVVALRTEGLRQVVTDDTTVALRLLVDRRDQLGRARTELVSRLHHLLLELVPGGAKKDLSAQQARAPCWALFARATWSARPVAGWPPS